MNSKLLIFAFSIAITTLSAQTSHIITAFDHGFTPENITILQGDTIVLESIGYHSITEVTEEDWNNNIPNSNGGFWIGLQAPTFDNWFVLNEVGLYHYICVPHAAMGMKGTIEVVDPTVGVTAAELNNSYTISPTGNGQYLLQFPTCDEFTVVTATGQHVTSESLRGAKEQFNLNLSNLASGVYLGIFVENNKGVRVVKFTR